MKEQFVLKKIKENIFQINEPWNTEGCNIFLFRKDSNCLVFDTGLGLFSLRNFIEKGGVNNFLVVLTHAHFDHIGGVKDFAGRECAIPKEIGDAMPDRNNWALEYLKAENFNEAQLFNLTSKTGQQICDDFTIQIPNIVPIETSVISWFDYSFEVMNLGGHSGDSCVYYDYKHKILLSGDLLYDGEIYANCYSSNKEQFARALNAIKQLDFKLVLPGHNSVMDRSTALLVIQRWLLELQ